MNYRVYRLNAAGRIISGDWIEADSDRAAQAAAETFWHDGAAIIELWQGVHQLAVLTRRSNEAAA